MGSLLSSWSVIRHQSSDNSITRHLSTEVLLPWFYLSPTASIKPIAPPHFTFKSTEPEQYLTYLTAMGQATRAWRIASTFAGPSPCHRLSWGTQAWASSQCPRRTHSQKNPKRRSRESASSFPKEYIFPGRRDNPVTHTRAMPRSLAGTARPRRRWALRHRPGTAAPPRRHLGRRLSWPHRRPGTRARRPPIGRAGPECK